MATHPDALKRLLAGPLHGTALAIYFLLLPYVVITKWNLAAGQSDEALVRAMLVVLAFFWSVFLVQLALNVWRLHQGRRPGPGGSAWLAGLVVAMLPFLAASTNLAHSLENPSRHESSASAAHRSQPWDLASEPTGPRGHRSGPEPVGALGTVPLALMAKRRSDLLRQQQFTDVDQDVDETVKLLRALDADLIRRLRQLIGARCDGVLEFRADLETTSTVTSSDPVVVCSLGDSDAGSLVAFAREGGRLAILPSWNGDDVRAAVVALHDGRIVFADNEADLLRSLATRTVRNTLVVYLGHAGDLDDELVECSITLTPHLDGARGTKSMPWIDRALGAQRSALSEVRVDLLRADPQVYGLCEPFAPTLRRRCIEMLAYLALHRHEPVTGDRLRTRVLTHADVDASLRTLANTASAVRRSVGGDARGQRLHPVTSSGLYVTHGITSDVEVFSTLVGRARQLSVEKAAPLARQALAMVKGEPLASALRGFEWFLAEGHGARLSRDGEWAALALHHDALRCDQYELAFWALQQGLLIDPYSDALLEAVARVPRLREFGGDRTGLAQDQTVGARRAEAMSWSFNGLSNQVTE
jgi:hypothetical protein